MIADLWHRFRLLVLDVLCEFLEAIAPPDEYGPDEDGGWYL